MSNTIQAAAAAFISAFDAWFRRWDVPTITVIGYGYPDFAEDQRRVEIDKLLTEAKRTGCGLANAFAESGEIDGANEVRRLLDCDSSEVSGRWKELRPLLELFSKQSFSTLMDESKMIPGPRVNISKPGGPAEYVRFALKASVAKLTAGESAEAAFNVLASALRGIEKMVRLADELFREGSGATLDNANEVHSLWALVRSAAEAIPSAVSAGPEAWDRLLRGLSYTLEVPPPPPFASTSTASGSGAEPPKAERPEAEPKSPPFVPLTSWADIFGALNEPHKAAEPNGKATLKSDARTRDLIRKLNEQHRGPIRFDSGKGKQPSVDKAALMAWWNGLSEHFDARKEEAEAEAEAARLTASETHTFGKSGTVSPKIGGSVKPQRKGKKGKEPES